MAAILKKHKIKSDEDVRGNKEKTFTISDILKLKSPTSCFLSTNKVGSSLVQFTEFKIRDLVSNSELFSVKKNFDNNFFKSLEKGETTIEEFGDADRTVHYNFSKDFFKLKTVGTTLVFQIGLKEIKSFRMIEKHYFKNKLLKSFDFNFGFCIPSSTNEIETVYDLPKLDEKTIKEMIANPKQTTSDSFYFVDDKLVMHNKATYTYH
ncbi:hypothetical protein HK099_000460 [Clydaea vesicula]|uniref:GMP phosphodiesterase delta subunit domain-containing protein n=1 Tax=Clydaea vesicula TaxID=447962 RepID=A0AAD5U8R4_9FUNG|nr:hypothetical protein HK099_000460 [Clydaea vesicula]